MTRNTWPRDQYTGVGGGAYTGVGGGLYTGSGGGMYTGPCTEPYRSNIPPWTFFIEFLEENGYEEFAELIHTYMP